MSVCRSEVGPALVQTGWYNMPWSRQATVVRTQTPNPKVCLSMPQTVVTVCSRQFAALRGAVATCAGQQRRRWQQPAFPSSELCPVNCAGRRDNVFVAGHSALGPALVRYALEQAGGLVLLASTILPEISDTFPTVSTW